MNRRLQRALMGALALGISGFISACAAAQAGRSSVQAPAHPSVHGTLHISLRVGGHLPRGGYYYAVLVLERYEHYSQQAPPPCATSSDMRRTAYGYPQPGGSVRLTLLPAKSASSQWCPGGSYLGAIYAVPHKPPCSRSYPCYGKTTQSGACWSSEGRTVCGVVIAPGHQPPGPKPEPPGPKPAPPSPTPAPYSYPGGLPKPIDASTRIIARFHVNF